MEGGLEANGGGGDTEERKTKDWKERNTEERQRRDILKRRMKIAESRNSIRSLLLWDCYDCNINMRINSNIGTIVSKAIAEKYRDLRII